MMTSLRDVCSENGIRFHSLNGADIDLVCAQVSGITLDSRQVEPGTAFAALQGENVHGITFVSVAQAQGTSLVLTDELGLQQVMDSGVDGPLVIAVHDTPRHVLGAVSAHIYGYPSHQLKLVGITGTSGKTTTAFMVKAACEAAGLRTGIMGTTGTLLGDTRYPSSLTTPEAPDVQRLLRTMADDGAEVVVMEVSSHALCLGRVDGCRFHVGAFLNLSQDHLDYHGSMTEYFAAKTRLFSRSLAVGSGVEPSESAVIVQSGEWSRQLAELRPDAVWVDRDAAAPKRIGWTASNIVTRSAISQSFTARYQGSEVDDSYDVKLALAGRYNISNALAALGIVQQLGADIVSAALGLQHASVPGRMQPVSAGQDFAVIVDYAHKPHAVASIISAVSELSNGRICVVIGAGGDRDSEKRSLMGSHAATGTDYVIITDDNPRSEDPAMIREAVSEGARSVENPPQIDNVASRHDAIATAVNWAQQDDVVLVLGKGHEQGQIMGDQTLPFDDYQVAFELLSQRTRT